MGNEFCPDRQITRQMQDYQPLQDKADLSENKYSRQQSVNNERYMSNISIVKQQQIQSSNFKQNDFSYQNDLSNKSAKNLNSLQRQEKDSKVHQIILQQILLQDGTRYIGYTKQQLPHGKGQEINNNGDVFKGYFQNGMKKGFGIYQFHNKDRYEGHFVENNMCGKGVYYYYNGDKYEGQFQNNKKHGRGIYHLKQPNNQKILMFQGQYKNDLKNGKGKLSCLGKTIQGIWQNGVYVNNQNPNF